MLLKIADRNEIVSFWVSTLQNEKVRERDRATAAHLLHKYGFNISKEVTILIKKYKKIYHKEKAIFNKLKQQRRHDKRNDFALTFEEWEFAVDYFNNRCAYCQNERKLTYDHLIPFSKGGSFTRLNILPCCSSCNSSKHNKDFNEWFVSRKFYSFSQQQKINDYLKLVRGK